MQTIRTISNISYNSPEFLEKTFKDLVARGVIDWAYWITHKADTDNTKQHTHLVLKPSARLDTAKLGACFNEFVAGFSKPLSTTAKWEFTNSIADWLLYGVHDVAYLNSKGQTRNIHYSFSDIKATDYEALLNDWNSIDRTKFDRLARITEAVKAHTPFYELVKSGAIPIAQRAQYEAQYKAEFVHQSAEELTNNNILCVVGNDGMVRLVCADDGVILNSFVPTNLLDNK